MKKTSASEKLIQDLLADPEEFYEKGKAYALLQQFFRGLPIKRLRPLLAHSDRMVRRAAVFVTSELGKEACGLLREVIPLVHDEDIYIQYHALEIIAVCSYPNNVEEFLHVIRSLESSNSIMRVLAMRLVSNASTLQLEAAARLFGLLGSSGESHKQGLTELLRANTSDSEKLIRLLEDVDPLLRKYAAIAIKNRRQKYPELISKLASSADADVQTFSEEFRDGPPTGRDDQPV